MSESVWSPFVFVDDFRYYKGAMLKSNELLDLMAERQLPSCGDGIRTIGEQCDDGNLVNADGCSDACAVEAGFVCSGPNTTVVAADTCTSGTYLHRIDFESLEDSTCIGILDDLDAELSGVNAVRESTAKFYKGSGYASLQSTLTNVEAIAIPLACEGSYDVVVRYTYYGADPVCNVELSYPTGDLTSTVGVEFLKTGSTSTWTLTEPVAINVEFSRAESDGTRDLTFTLPYPTSTVDRVPVSGANDAVAEGTLQACTGECDTDLDCAPGLLCFQRQNGEDIPGCDISTQAGRDWDYCYDPTLACTSRLFIDQIEVRPRGQTIATLPGDGGGTVPLPFQYASTDNEGATFAVGAEYAYEGGKGMLLKSQVRQNVRSNWVAFFDLALEGGVITRSTAVEFAFNIKKTYQYWKVFAVTISAHSVGDWQYGAGPSIGKCYDRNKNFCEDDGTPYYRICYEGHDTANPPWDLQSA